MSDLATISAQLASLTALVEALAKKINGSAIPAYQAPSLSSADIAAGSADGVTIQRDGSTWITSRGESGPVGSLIQSTYGYISEEKNPAAWAAIRKALGDAAFKRWNDSRDPWGLYKSDPSAIASGEINALNIAYLLNPYGRHVQ